MSNAGYFEIEEHAVTASLKGYFGDEEEVIVPAGVTDIANAVFAYKSLKRLVLPKGFLFLGHEAFQGCVFLESVTLPDTLKRIGSNCFCRCIGLKELALPDSVETIGRGAFLGCTALQRVRLPAALRQLNAEVFAGCHELRAVYIPAGLEKIDERAFFDAGKNELSFTVAEGNKSFAVKGKRLIDVRTGKALWEPLNSSDEDAGKKTQSKTTERQSRQKMPKRKLQDALDELIAMLGEVEKKENDEINFFDAVNMAGQEIRHSAFFAWLFDSSYPHGLGNKVLKEFFEQLYPFERNADILGRLIVNGSPIGAAPDPVAVFGELVQGETKTYRERDHIDILIEVPRTETVVVIENKTGTLSHDNQLMRYSDIVGSKYPNYKKIFIYMTVTGDDPINRGGENDMQVNEDYCKFTYREFLAVLERVKKNISRKSSQGQKLTIILEDYIKMVTNNLLHENPDAYELCEMIVDDHGEAVEAIDAYRASATSKKVLQYCKAFLGAVTTKDTQQFMTQKMEAAFANEKKGDPKSLFHIVLTYPSNRYKQSKKDKKTKQDNKKGYQLKIELETPKKGGWTPVQAAIIKALEDAGMVPHDHTDSTVGVLISGTSKSMELLTKEERMKPFADIQPLLDERLTEFKKTITRLEAVLDTLPPIAPAQP